MRIDNFPEIAASIEDRTLTVDFGPSLPSGVQLIGTPSVTLTVADGSPETDPTPQARVSGSPVIVTAPKPNGSGLANCAVAFRFVGGVAGVVYKAVYSCSANNGDTPELDNQFYCYTP